MEYPNFVGVCRDLSLERLLVLSRWIRKEAKAKGKTLDAPALEIQEEGQTERARIRMGKLVERERMKKVMSKESLPRVRGKMIDNNHENGHNKMCRIHPLPPVAIFVLLGKRSREIPVECRFRSLTTRAIESTCVGGSRLQRMAVTNVLGVRQNATSSTNQRMKGRMKSSL